MSIIVVMLIIIVTSIIVVTSIIIVPLIIVCTYRKNLQLGVEHQRPVQDPLLHSAQHDSTVEEFKRGHPLEVPLLEVAFDGPDGPADSGIFDQQAAVAL